MSKGDTIAFTCDLTEEENLNLKSLAEYNNRSMRGQFKEMIRLDYEEMKQKLGEKDE